MRHEKDGQRYKRFWGHFTCQNWGYIAVLQTLISMTRDKLYDFIKSDISLHGAIFLTRPI